MSGDTMHIPLRRRDGTVRAYARIDVSDHDAVARFRWHLMGAGYAARDVGGRKVYLHRVLAGLAAGDPREVDHKDRDRLDCRRANLRVVPKRGNRQNVAGRGTSRFRGVCWAARRGRWLARVQGDGAYWSGWFDDEVEAARAVEAKRRELMPWALPDPQLSGAAA